MQVKQLNRLVPKLLVSTNITCRNCDCICIGSSHLILTHMIIWLIWIDMTNDATIYLYVLVEITANTLNILVL